MLSSEKEEKGDSIMKKNRVRSFFGKKSHVFSVILMFVAVVGMSGIYMSQQRSDQRYAELEAQRAEEILGYNEEQELESVDMVLVPEVVEEAPEIAEEAELAEVALEEAEPVAEEAEETAETAVAPVAALSFSAETELGWPLQGNVILNFSMDQTVYFATLDQYKYNPALIIQAQVNDKIRAVARGRVLSIETSEVTGLTMTVELGDGYSVVYGQLKETAFGVGDLMNAGDVLGYVNEPTKYFSVEGPNLYFQLLKNGVSVDPMEYLQ
jgi:septal ring factor EnvC (AmiA/AmiB activator)